MGLLRKNLNDLPSQPRRDNNSRIVIMTGIGDDLDGQHFVDVGEWPSSSGPDRGEAWSTITNKNKQRKRKKVEIHI